MSTAQEEAARAALRERLGAGARYDSPNAPHRELGWARRGTAYFARKLNELADADLDEPSLLEGWNRRALIAHVGYNARALARLVEWARTGVETPMYSSLEQRNAEIKLGATLPSRALRNLFQHSEVHLNVEWRDLADPNWDSLVRTIQGRTVPAKETAWMRTREVWVHAIDLRNGGSFYDIPPEILDALLQDVLRAWASRQENIDFILAPTNRGDVIPVRAGGEPRITGSTADLVRWLTGRGERGLTSSNGEIPAIPRWL